jgi:hypothetical protein
MSMLTRAGVRDQDAEQATSDRQALDDQDRNL